MATCKICKQDKPKVGRIEKTSTGGVKYVYFMEPDIRLWWGAVCPDCHAVKAKAERKKEPVTLSCSECKKSFETFKPSQVVCSLRCRELRRTRQAREKRTAK